jgi:hypothetical protein
VNRETGHGNDSLNFEVSLTIDDSRFTMLNNEQNAEVCDARGDAPAFSGTSHEKQKLVTKNKKTGTIN